MVFLAIHLVELLISLNRAGDKTEEVTSIPEERERTDALRQVSRTYIYHHVQDAEQNVGQSYQQIGERKTSQGLKEGKALQEYIGDKHRNHAHGKYHTGAAKINE